MLGHFYPMGNSRFGQLFLQMGNPLRISRAEFFERRHIIRQDNRHRGLLKFILRLILEPILWNKCNFADGANRRIWGETNLASRTNN